MKKNSISRNNLNKNHYKENCFYNNFSIDSFILIIVILLFFIFSAFNLSSCSDKNQEKKEEQGEATTKNMYIASAPAGNFIRFEEGEYIEYEEVEDVIGIIGAFDIKESVFSYVQNDRARLATLSSDMILTDDGGSLGKFLVKNDKVMVEAATFLKAFGFNIIKEQKSEVEKDLNKEEKSNDSSNDISTEEVPYKNDNVDDGINQSENTHENENLQTYMANKNSPDKLLMAWDNNPINYDRVYPDSLDVIIPKAMSLDSEDGSFSKNLEFEYVKNAKSQDKDVWLLVNNGFNPDMTKKTLNSYSKRQKMINSINSFVTRNFADGVSLDFENMFLDDSDLFVQFVAELNLSLKKNRKLLGVCVTVPGGSDMWSKVYDRKRIAQNSDYLMLMAYDQYWASSQTSGPVASYSWVRENVEKTKEFCSPDKIILGVPFYTRYWMEKYSEEEANHIDVSSISYYMYGINRIIAELDEKSVDYKKVWDNQAGQYFYVYFDSEEDKIVKFWLEDTDSVVAKTGIINEADLSGAAFWAMGFEEDEVWEKLSEIK